MLKRIAFLLFLFPAAVLAEDQMVTLTDHETRATVQVAFDGDRMCLHNGKVYSLGAVESIDGKPQRCVYHGYNTAKFQKGAIWEQWNEAAKEFVAQ